MIVRELVAKLGFTVDDKGLQKAEGLLGKLKTHLLALGAGAIATGLFSLAKSAADYGDAVFKSSQKTGLAVEEFQKLAYAAELADVNNEEFSLGLAQLSKRLVDLADGGESSADAFKAVGVSAKTAGGQVRPTQDVLLEIANAFQKMPDGPRKTALAMDLFGKSGVKLIPLLNSGSASIKELGTELEAMGGVMDEASAKRAEAFNDNLTTMRKRMQSLKNSIGAAVIPYVNKAVEALGKWFRQNKDVIEQGLETVVEGLAGAFQILWDALSAGYGVLNRLIKLVGGSEKALKLLKLALVGFAAFKTISFLNSLSFSFKNLWTVMKANPFASIIAIAAVVIAVIDDIYAYLEGRPSIFGIIVEWAKKAWDWIKSIFNQVWEFLVGVFEGIKNAIANELNAIWQDVQNIGSLIVSAFTTIWDGVTNGIKSVSEWFSWLWGKIDGLLGITDKLKAAWDGLIAAWQSVKGFFSGEEVNLGRTAEEIDKVTAALVEMQRRRDSELVGKTGAAPSRPSSGMESAIASVAPSIPTSIPGAVQNNNTTQNNAFSMPVKVEVNVESTADPNEIGNIAAKAAATHLDGVLRSAAQNLESTMSR